MSESATAASRLHGFDYLRASMALAVIAWHCGVFRTSAVFDVRRLPLQHFDASDLLNFHGLLLAVPVFFLVSTLLFCERPDLQRGPGLRRRLIRLGLLYGFWVGLWTLVVVVPADRLPGSPGAVFAYLVQGGYSIFYFLFSLLAVTLATAAALRLPRPGVWLLLLASLAYLWIAPFLTVRSGDQPALVAYWNPLNFLPYGLMAILLAGRGHALAEGRRGLWLLGGIAAAVVLAGAVEWSFFVSRNHVPYNGFGMPAYTRLSVALGALFLVMLSLRVDREAPPRVRWLGDLSLGLFCVHPFVLFALLKLVPHRVLVDLGSLGIFAVVAGLSLAIAPLLRRVLPSGLI